MGNLQKPTSLPDSEGDDKNSSDRTTIYRDARLRRRPHNANRRK
jgi:hypothetical protein